MGMADGFAQASGAAAHVNLHTAPGVGNGMGAIFNAQANHSPLLVTAGQQARSLITLQANLTNRDATRMPHPLVKWSYEPPRAEDVPHALARGAHLASLPPQGPAFVSIPMDDWGAEPDPRPSPMRLPQGRRARRRRPPGGGRRSRDAWSPPRPGADGRPRRRRRRRLGRRRRPRRAPADSRSSPPPRRAAGGSASPRVIRCSRASCRRRSAPSRRRWMAGTWCWWSAPRSSPTTPTSPGRCCRRAHRWWRSPAIPTRPPARPMGDAIVADVALTLAALLAELEDSDREPPPARPAPERPRETDPLTPGRSTRRSPGSFPMTGSSCSNPRPRRWRCETSCGWGGPAATSSGPAAGSGSAWRRRSASSSPSPTARWSACSARARPSTRSRGCGRRSPTRCRSPSWSCATTSTRSSSGSRGLEEVEGAPGLDLPALECSALASAYGVSSRRVRARDELQAALADAIASARPELVEVGVSPGMALA